MITALKDASPSRIVFPILTNNLLCLDCGFINVLVGLPTSSWPIQLIQKQISIKFLTSNIFRRLKQRTKLLMHVARYWWLYSSHGSSLVQLISTAQDLYIRPIQTGCNWHRRWHRKDMFPMTRCHSIILNLIFRKWRRLRHKSKN